MGARAASRQGGVQGWGGGSATRPRGCVGGVEAQAGQAAGAGLPGRLDPTRQQHAPPCTRTGARPQPHPRLPPPCLPGDFDFLSATEWPGLAEEDVLLSPPQCRTIWRQFTAESTLAVQQVCAGAHGVVGVVGRPVVGGREGEREGPVPAGRALHVLHPSCPSKSHQPGQPPMACPSILYIDLVVVLGSTYYQAPDLVAEALRPD